MKVAWIIALFLVPVAQGLLIYDEPQANPSPAQHDTEPPVVPEPLVAADPAPDLPTEAEPANHDNPAFLAPFYPIPEPTPRNAPGAKELEFWCPNDGTGTPTQIGLLTVVYTCPQRIYDFVPAANTGYLLGNVDLDVNEAEPMEMAFATLHGAADADGPNGFSRTGLTHSMFPSPDMGVRWADEWTDDSTNGGSYGEQSAALLDASGNMYVAYTWAQPIGNMYDYYLYVYKGDHVSQPSEQLRRDIYPSAQYYGLIGREEGNAITNPDLTLVWAPEEPAKVNGSVPPGEYGDYTVDRDVTGDVILTYHERASDWATTSTNKSGWIDIHWTNTTRTNTQGSWDRIDMDQLIGPCRDASNAVAWDGRIYIACTVDAGYDARTSAKVGQVDLWSFDPATGQTSFESYTRIKGDHPKLAVTEDGYFAVMTSRYLKEQQVEVKASMGWHGLHWNQQHNVGSHLHEAMGAMDMYDAHITAIDIASDTRTVFAVYKEWNNVGNETDDPQASEPGQKRLKGYNKFIFTMDECTALIAGAELRTGDALVSANLDVYQEEGLKESPGVYNEVDDGMDVVRMESGEELVWFAIGDYGAVQFGAVRALSGAGDTPCITLPPPPVIPLVAPIPAALALTTGASMTTAAAFGVPAVAMVGYLLTVKRRQPSFAVAEDN